MIGKKPLQDKTLIYSCAAVVRFGLDMSILISTSIYVHLLVRRGLQKASSSFLMNSGVSHSIIIQQNYIKYVTMWFRILLLF